MTAIQNQSGTHGPRDWVTPNWVTPVRWALAALAATMMLAALAGAAAGQSLAVQPVSLPFAPGQRATTLTVTNHGTNETAIQIRVYAWSQEQGEDTLTPSDAVIASPPLATIPAGGSQLVRLVLRQPPDGREFTYRILLDEIPPPALAGVVRIVLRMSIPIFAEPKIPVAPRVQFHIEKQGEQLLLVGVNSGIRHETFREVVLATEQGVTLKPAKGWSPYLLAGATRRWVMVPTGSASAATLSSTSTGGERFRLTARGDGGVIDQQVSRAGSP